tara:strand:- start:8797 stop:9579 length:783 start_codon:yes stop_codon:yes gene_type:complete
MLKFSPANAKTEALKQVEELKPFLADKRKIYSLDLLSGYSCPFAHECLSKAVADENGKRTIQDGKYTKFRCFSASQEVQYNGVYNLRKHNYDSLRGLHVNDMIHHLHNDLPKNAGIIRIHVAGDFFNSDYMQAWYNVAVMNPSVLFYGYTKSIRYWQFHINEYPILNNFVLTASYGGRDDELISEYGLRSTTVVFSEAEAEALGLEIDHDDSHAARPSLRDQDFALLIHGTQPKDTAASEALKLLKKNKVRHSYNRKVTV